MLERLERRNLFVVPLDDDRRWYRYHHLFADLLQARLHQSGPDPVARLFSRATEWCEREGLIAEAVGTDEIETVWSWLDALPESVVRSSAPLSIACCWVLWHKGQIGPIEARLVDAERALGELAMAEGLRANDELYAGLLPLVAALRSIVVRYHSEFEAAIAYAERALDLVPENLPPQVNAQLRSVVSTALAAAHDGAGNLERAADAYAEAIRWSRLGRSATGVALTHRLTGLLRLLGRLRRADEACREALQFMEEQGMPRLPATAMLHLAMSEVLLERNDLEAAEEHLSRGLELGRWTGRFDAAKGMAHGVCHRALRSRSPPPVRDDRPSAHAWIPADKP